MEYKKLKKCHFGDPNIVCERLIRDFEEAIQNEYLHPNRRKIFSLNQNQ
jgi:hypothetical protein